MLNFYKKKNLFKKSTKEDVKDSTTILLKADKELKPASMRVKEAAEAVLCILMEYTVINFNFFSFVSIVIQLHLGSTQERLR